LIMLAKRQLFYYKKYLVEMEQILDAQSLILKGNDYEELRNKISYLDIFLLNLFGDETKSALSYRKFRKLINRNKHEICILEDLPKKIIEYLDELNNLRNWAAHIPESLLNAEFEGTDFEGKRISKEDFLKRPSPINVTIFQTYDRVWIELLYKESIEAYECYRNILQQMRIDYSRLIDSQVEVIVRFPDTIRKKHDFELPRISFDMQNKTYKRKVRDDTSI
ncbi:hypothetical protein, partial [Paenibacillus odorifer]|uniref:hypothetical protein n=1 Tax=Paenibacillus odorifer TaxID=189426 RepID=UPI0015C34432